MNGLGLLPWERLPPLVLGPILLALSVLVFATGDSHTLWRTASALASAMLGAGLIVYGIWRRYVRA